MKITIFVAIILAIVGLSVVNAMAHPNPPVVQAAPTDPTSNLFQSECSDFGCGVVRTIDREHGYLCYSVKDGGIWCTRLEQDDAP